MDSLANGLSRSQRDLLRATEPERLAGLDEEALVRLHKRVRKARTKYVGVYRRAGSRKVSAKGARGAAKQSNAHNAARAEVFEDALARVSAQLARAAAEAAAQLRAERLGAAASPGTWPGSDQTTASADSPGQAKVIRRTPRGAGLTRRAASIRSTGARHQARRDAR